MPEDEWEGLPDEDSELLTDPLTVPVTDTVPQEEADCDTLELGESVPETEEHPVDVTDTELVEDTEGQLEGVCVPLMVPLTVPVTDKVPLEEAD